MRQEYDLIVLSLLHLAPFRVGRNIFLLILLSAKWQPQRKTSKLRSKSKTFDRDYRIYHKRYGKIYYACVRRGRSQRECYHVCFLKTYSIQYFTFFFKTLQRTHAINVEQEKVEQKIGSYWFRFKMRKRQMNERKADGKKVGAVRRRD